MKQRLTETAIEAIRGHGTLKADLASFNGKNSTMTINNWLNANDPNGMLTTHDNVRLISEKTGLASTEILEEVSNG